MLSEGKESLRDYVSKNKKVIFLALVFIFGALMLLFSSGGSEEKDSEGTDSLYEYKANLEAELEDICASVQGVGKCRVTVSFERGEEKEYKGSALIGSRPPKVLGVTVICRGADSDLVRSELIGMMSALFDIGTNRISVLKLN